MTAAGGLSGLPIPIEIKEEHGVTEAQVHCDIELSDERLASINSNLQDVGLSPIESRRKRPLRCAIPGEEGGFWEFRIELYVLSGRNSESPSLHFLVVVNNLVRTEPIPHRRSRRTLENIKALVDAVFREGLEAELDCSVTWHPSTDLWPLPSLLPMKPRFPEDSVIQEISGVIGGSADGTVKFVVDRVATDPMLFHIWLGFKRELPLSSKVMVEVISQGVSMLEGIDMWRE